jgi:preprotein translocase subunit SecG
MLLLAFLFVVMIIALAFVINSALDRREERRLRRDSEERAASPDRGL